jgi:hypothetical protein
MNYALIKPNNVYEELYDILEDNDLNMHNINNFENVKYHIKKYIESINYVEFIKTYTNDTMNEIVKKLDELTLVDSLEINTILLYSNEFYAYEAIYLKNENEELNNQYATISNIDLLCINGNVAIIKTLFKESKYISSNITLDDLYEIIIKNFFHIGLMINPDNTMIELEFNTDKPFNTIGNTFKAVGTIELFNVAFMLYSEDSKEKNTLASKLFSNYSNITGRCFITVLSPESHLKFMDLTKLMFNNIIKLIDNNSVIKNDDNRVHNPFYYFS